MSQMGLAGVIEVFGGAAIALGLFTSPVAFIASGEMAVAYFQAHAPRGFWPIANGGELAALNCFVFLYFAAVGSGTLSIDSLRHRSRVPLRKAGLGLARLLAERVDGRGGREDEGARKDREPRLGRHRRLRLIQHVAPARGGGLHADAEEAERRLEQNPAAHRQRRGDSDRRQRPGQQVRRDDRSERGPERARAGRIALAMRQHSARMTRAVSIQPTRPTSTMSSSTEGLRIAAADHQQRQSRHREHRVGERISTASTRAAGPRARGADRHADRAGHGCREQADSQRDARPEEHARQHVPPQSSVPNQCASDGAARRLARSSASARRARASGARDCQRQQALPSRRAASADGCSSPSPADRRSSSRGPRSG